ncbi:hypothetical protein BCR43DRAFT_518111 [Syncephalastrum racemosum]|uniref:LysM domain-containing protein n=1 Tax=Syncephalastrum racemosum TaxID=13706 RepID=A0A1X2H2S5_SYNRA|nr:hypothetical protein BCR43DRAFT_518111 [Syncephalastrum racemosum]
MAVTVKNDLEVVPEIDLTVAIDPPKYSASYVSVFARDNDPEFAFELVDDDQPNVHSKVVSFKRRGLSGCESEHTAKSGDTCLSITDKYGIHIDDFMFWNPQVNSNCKNLKTGKKYCVKNSSADSPDGCTLRHKVVKGDTCKKVAKQYGIALQTFYDLNSPINTGSCNNLKLGRSYCISKESSSGNKKSNTKSKETKEEKTAAEDAIKKEAKDQKDDSKKIKDSTTHLASKTSSDDKGSNDSKDSSNVDDKKNDDKKNDDKKNDDKKNDDKNDDKKNDDKQDDDKKESSSSTDNDGWTSTETPVKNDKDKGDDKKDESSSSSSTEKRKRIQSNVPMTYYWIAQPDDYSQKGKQVTIKTCDGKSLGKTSVEYADALVMEGTGVLGSKVVNLGACSCTNYNCFMEVDKHDNPYGLTSHSSPLRPFVTVAANDIARGTKIYVPQLDGWDIPGSSKKHNGCLLVDDRGWSFSSRHIDFYVYSMKNYESLNKEHGINKVDVYQGGRCKLLSYV